MEKSAGALLYTIIDGEIKYLVSLDFHNNWGFPKGHLENNETDVQAAIREIKEEVGIDATIDEGFARELIYTMPNGKLKRSIYYIGKYENQIPYKQLEEVKDIKILSFKEVLDILTFDSMKQILIEANNYLDR